MSELDDVYGDRIDFDVIVPTIAEDGELQYPETSPHVASHGLEAVDANGELIEAIEGHAFGKDEIEAVVRRVLGEDA